MKDQLLYVELKSGFSDNGPAWIRRGKQSKSGRTIYFNDQAFQSLAGSGIQGNYLNIETSTGRDAVIYFSINSIIPYEPLRDTVD